MTSDALDFRTAAPGDLTELHALIESAYRGERARAGWTHEADLVEGPRTTREALATAMESADDRLLIASRQGQIVGCVQLTRSAPDAAYLGMLTVEPHQQGAGVGKHLLACAEAAATRLFGATMMELSVVSVRAELLAYYERRGYALTGEVRPFPVALDPPLILLVMAKRLGIPPLTTGGD
jgi:ribosomal protein S18 acetylase RimI-like enzyme